MGKQNLTGNQVQPYTFTKNPIDGTEYLEPIEGLRGIQATVNHDEKHLHLGDTYETTYYKLDLAAGASLNFYIQSTSENSLHIISLEAEHTGDLLFEWFDHRRGNAFLYDSGGTDLKPQTGNNSQDYGDNAIPASHIRLDPVLSPAANTPLWGRLFIGGSTGNVRIPIIGKPNEKIITKSGSAANLGGGVALLKFTNLTNSESKFSFSMMFVDEEPGGLRG